MANQQLVEYIKQQIQLGVQKDAIKNTLITSGWPEADIQDAMGGAGASSAPSMTSDIRPQSGAAAAAEPAKKPEAQFQAKIDARASQPAAAAASPVMASASRSSGGEGRSWKRFILPGIMGLIILALGGGAFYLYAANAELNDELVNGSQSNGELTRQVASLSQEKSNLSSEVQRLTEVNAANAVYLTFFLPDMSPASSSNPTLNATLKGTLRGDDKAGYTLTTDNGIVFTLKNAKDPAVMNMIKPLINNGLQIMANYRPGTRDLTITAVNGTQVPAPAAVASASSTAATPAVAPAPAPNP